MAWCSSSSGLHTGPAMPPPVPLYSIAVENDLMNSSFLPSNRKLCNLIWDGHLRPLWQSTNTLLHFET